MERSVQVEALVLRVVGGRGPVERLRALSALRRELDSVEAELAAQAVDAGASWRQIGDAIGVSKQAAHRRHSAGVAAREPAAGRRSAEALGVSVYARRAIRLARVEAARMGETEFGTEHLLLGILQCGDAEAGELLRRFGVTLNAALDAVQPTTEMTLAGARRSYAANEQGGAARVVSPLARRVMERALTRAAARGEQELSALDLLGSTLAHDDAGATRTLRTLGVDPAELRAEIAPRS